MRYLELPPPDWSTLPGGSEETASWLAARARKLANAAEAVPLIHATAVALDDASALFQCTPEVLQAIPYAAQFYLDLLALTDKTLSVLSKKTVEAGLTIKPSTIANNLRTGRAVSRANLEAFSRFVNDDLQSAIPEEWRSASTAAGMVLTVEGARIQGRVQNEAGDDAVVLLKTLLVAAMEDQSMSVEVGTGAGDWRPYAPSTNLLEYTSLRFERCLECEFLPGGNRPDIVISLRDLVIAVGEVKGRKDLSNLWESWMPQIAGHLRNWMFSHPEAKRLFFGTVITQEMIDGVTAAGTQHAGLRVMRDNGMLATAYNLSLIASGDQGAGRAFEILVDRLCELIFSVCYK